jgi:hypothetical protein
MKTRYGGLGTVIALCGALYGGCTFEEGQPWGQAELSVSARLDDAGRPDAQGRLRTSTGYLVELEGFEVSFGAANLNLRPAGTNVSFDPASPPEGFSLCHNGHCHSADGRLVDYEDVAAEVAQRAGVSGGVSWPLDVGALLTGEAVELPLGPCSGGCELPTGELSTFEVTMTGAKVRARVLRASDEGEVAVVDLDAPLAVVLRVPVEGEVGKDAPVGVRLDARVEVSAKWLDEVPWEAGEPSALEGSLGGAIFENTTITLDVARHEL